MDIKTVKEYLNKKELKAKKHFGQNFLIDNNILEKIVNSSNIKNDEIVIEIGPGMGSLTEFLLKKAKKVICYEIDHDMVDILNEKFRDNPNIQIIEKDFLKVKDFDLINKEKVKIVANLPYYITTPILLKILEEMDFVTECVVMMQKEVALRICGKPKTKDYNALSVLVQYKHSANLEFDVQKGCFYPEPDVTSSIVKIAKKKEYIKPINEKFFYSFNRNIFKQRRKTLYNNIKNSYNFSKEEIEEKINKAGLKATTRSEELSISEIIKLADLFFY